MANEHPGGTGLDRFECVLPERARAELRRNQPAKPIQPPPLAVCRGAQTIAGHSVQGLPCHYSGLPGASADVIGTMNDTRK
jgi:hypothetical protein